MATIDNLDIKILANAQNAETSKQSIVLIKLQNPQPKLIPEVRAVRSEMIGCPYAKEGVCPQNSFVWQKKG